MFPDVANLDQLVIGFTLIFFRVAGLMLSAPLFGSARVPRRFKLLIALVIALAMASGALAPVPLPASTGALTVGLLGEIAFGVVLGQVVSLVFIAAQWAGEMVGQQVGLNVSEVLDPQFGAGGTVVSDLYFMLATAAFLLLGGHRQLVLGVHASLTACPPLSFLLTRSLFDFFLGFLNAATSLALRLAAPMFVTMLIVDVAMGCISKTMPQLNVMSAGMAVRGMIGILVLALGVHAVATAVTEQLDNNVDAVLGLFATGHA